MTTKQRFEEVMNQAEKNMEYVLLPESKKFLYQIKQSMNEYFKLIKDLLKPQIKELRKGFRPKPSKENSACADIRASITSSYSLKGLKMVLLEIRPTEPVAVNGKLIPREHNDDYYEYLTKVAENVTQYVSVEEGIYNAVFIEPNQSVKFGTGFAISLPHLPEPFVAVYEIHSRSGLGINFKLTITNNVGIIDVGYLDEIQLSLTNNSKHLHIITDGARVAQGKYGIVVQQSSWKDEEVLVDEFSSGYDRGGGLGSSKVI